MWSVEIVCPIWAINCGGWRRATARHLAVAREWQANGNIKSVVG